MARAEASSPATSRRVACCSRSASAIRATASASPAPVRWETCQPAASSRRSAAPGAALAARSAVGTSAPRANASAAGASGGQSTASRWSADPGGWPAVSSAASCSHASRTRTEVAAAADRRCPPPPQAAHAHRGQRRDRRQGEPPPRQPGDRRGRQGHDGRPAEGPAGRPGRTPAQGRRPGRSHRSTASAAQTAARITGRSVRRARALRARPARARCRRRRPRWPSTRGRTTPARARPPRGAGVGRSGVRTTCTTASSAAASWLCAAARGSPAASASASTRAGTSAAELAWMVPEPPSWPVLRAASSSVTSAPRTSPTTSRSGRIRSAWRTRSRTVISPAVSMLGGRASKETTCGCAGLSSAESSTTTTRSAGSTRPSSVESRVVFPDPVPPLTRSAARARDQVLQQPGSRRGQGARGHQLVEGERDPRGHPQRQRRPGARDGREHGVQPRAVGEAHVHVRRGVVETPAAARGQPLRQAADRLVVGEADLGGLQARTPVDVDPVGAVDQDVGDARQPQQRLEEAGPEHVAAQRVVDREDRGVADRQPGLPERLGHPRRREVAGPAAEPVPHRLDDAQRQRPRGHAARALGVSDARTSSTARPSGPRRDRTGPRPRSRASASPRWPGMSTTDGDQRDPLDLPRRDPLPADHQPGRCRPAQPRGEPGRRRDTAHRRHGHHQQEVAAGDHLDHEGVARAGQVDDHQVVAPARGRERLPHRERLHRAARTGRPGEHAEAVSPGDGVVQRACAEPPGRLLQRIPADPVALLEPEDPVQAGTQRVEVDHDRRTAAGPDLTERAGEGRRPGSAAAAHHGHDPAQARRPVARVGEHLDQPRLRARQLGDALGAHRQGHREQVVGDRPGDHDVGRVPAARPEQGHLAGHVGAEEDQRRGRPGGQRVGHRTAHPGRHTSRRGEPEQLVEQRRVSGDHQWCAHAVEPSRGAAGHGRVADVPGDTGCRSVACGHPPGRSAPGTPAALLR